MQLDFIKICLAEKKAFEMLIPIAFMAVYVISAILRKKAAAKTQKAGLTAESKPKAKGKLQAAIEAAFNVEEIKRAAEQMQIKPKPNSTPKPKQTRAQNLVAMAKMKKEQEKKEKEAAIAQAKENADDIFNVKSVEHAYFKKAQDYRDAIVYSEILARPVALRDSQMF